MVDICWSVDGGWHAPARAAVRPDHARPGRGRAALRAGDLRGDQGLPPRRRLDLDVPPEQNARRLQRSARRLALPELPDGVLHRSRCASSSRSTARGCPTAPETSLYLRPFMFAKEAFLGVRPAQKVDYYVIASPAGAYFPGGVAPGVDLALRGLRPRRQGRHGRGEDRRQLRRVAAAAGRGVRARLRPGGVPRPEERQRRRARRHERRASSTTTARSSRPALGTILEGITRDSVLQLARGPRPQGRGAPRLDRRVARGRRIRRHRRGVRVRHRRGGHADRPAQGRAASRSAPPTRQPGELTMSLREELTDIQYGRRPDHHGWMLRLA